MLGQIIVHGRQANLMTCEERPFRVQHVRVEHDGSPRRLGGLGPVNDVCAQFSLKTGLPQEPPRRRA